MDPGKEGFIFKTSDTEIQNGYPAGENMPKTKKMFSNLNELNNSEQFKLSLLEAEIIQSDYTNLMEKLKPKIEEKEEKEETVQPQEVPEKNEAVEEVDPPKEPTDEEQVVIEEAPIKGSDLSNKHKKCLQQHSKLLIDLIKS